MALISLFDSLHDQLSDEEMHSTASFLMARTRQKCMFSMRTWFFLQCMPSMDRRSDDSLGWYGWHGLLAGRTCSAAFQRHP